MARKTRKRPAAPGAAAGARWPLGLDRVSVPAAAALLALLTLAVYASSLGGRFVFDDTVIVQGNRAIQGLDLAHLKEIFGGHYWKAVETRGGLYRPVVMLSYALNHAAGGEDPFGYHLVNVLLHAGNAILVLLLVDALFERRALALVSALLFALHPIRTEAVASVVGRAESLAATFVLLAWLGYVRARKERRPALLWLSAAAFALGALTKESSLGFVLVLPLVDLLVGQGPLRSRFRPAETALRYAPYLAALSLVLALRFLVLGGLAPLYVNPSSNPLVRAGAGTRFLTATHVFARYVGLLILPLRLSADYSFDAVPLVTSLASVRALLPLALLGAVLAGTAAAARRTPFLLFCGWSFLALFLPASNWLRVIGTLMAERLIYLPSLGFTCALAWVLVRALDRPGWRTAAAGAGLALGLAYGARTIERNRDWHDHHALFASAVQAVPRSSLAQANLAAILLDERNDPRGAVEHGRRAVAIYPEDPAAYYTLGEAHRRLGELDAAIEAFEEVARRAPRTTGGAAALRAVIDAQERSNRPAAAAAAAERLRAWRPHDAALRVTLARLYRAAGDRERAREALDEARRLAPSDPAVARALDEAGR